MPTHGYYTRSVARRSASSSTVNFSPTSTDSESNKELYVDLSDCRPTNNRNYLKNSCWNRANRENYFDDLGLENVTWPQSYRINFGKVSSEKTHEFSIKRLAVLLIMGILLFGLISLYLDCAELKSKVIKRVKASCENQDVSLVKRLEDIRFILDNIKELQRQDPDSKCHKDDTFFELNSNEKPTLYI